jgi:hypothetical protein
MRTPCNFIFCKYSHIHNCSNHDQQYPCCESALAKPFLKTYGGSWCVPRVYVLNKLSCLELNFFHGKLRFFLLYSTQWSYLIDITCSTLEEGKPPKWLKFTQRPPWAGRSTLTTAGSSCRRSQGEGTHTAHTTHCSHVDIRTNKHEHCQSTPTRPHNPGDPVMEFFRHMAGTLFLFWGANYTYSPTTYSSCESLVLLLVKCEVMVLKLENHVEDLVLN